MNMVTEAVNQLTGKWWTFLLRGIVALALAAFAFAEPATMASGLVYVFAAYFIISGIALLVAGFSFTGVGHWWAFILLGLVQGALGVLMLAEPGAGPLALAYLFALWLITSGTTEISAAIALRSVIKGEFWYVLLGIVTLAVGFYVILTPELGVLALVYTVGFYAILAGVSLIAFGFKIKNVGSDVAKNLHVTA